MIVSIYRESEEILVRLANVVMEDKSATFTAPEGGWDEITHYSIRKTYNGSAMLAPLKQSVSVRGGDSLTLDLRNVGLSIDDGDVYVHELVKSF